MESIPVQAFDKFPLIVSHHNADVHSGDLNLDRLAGNYLCFLGISAGAEQE